MTPQWMIISFYTPTYKKVAKKLIGSLAELGVPFRVLEVSDQGSWVENCAKKAPFIRGCLMEYARPVIWIDADAVVHEYPAIFDYIKEDFAAHWKGGKELLSGTMFFNNTPGSHRLLEDWTRQQLKQPKEWDQRTLHHVLKTSEATVKELPATYTQIFDTMRNEGNPVIEHFQESRKLRRRT